VGVELIVILPAGPPKRCLVRHGWMAKVPPATDEERAGYQDLFDLVHAAVCEEDFGMLPQCGDGIRHGQHEYMRSQRDRCPARRGDAGCCPWDRIRALRRLQQIGITATRNMRAIRATHG